LQRRNELQAKGHDLEKVVERVGEVFGMSREEALDAGKRRRTVYAGPLHIISLPVEVAGWSLRGRAGRIF